MQSALTLQPLLHTRPRVSQRLFCMPPACGDALARSRRPRPASARPSLCAHKHASQYAWRSSAVARPAAPSRAPRSQYTSSKLDNKGGTACVPPPPGLGEAEPSAVGHTTPRGTRRASRVESGRGGARARARAPSRVQGGAGMPGIHEAFSSCLYPLHLDAPHQQAI